MSESEYYDLSDFALEIFQKRYAIHEKETWFEACDRVASHVAVAEGEEFVKYKEEFSYILKRNLFCPGGRILYGAGRPKGQLMNCFVVPTSDSREGWGKTVSDIIVVCGTGGGVGCNFSSIRPRGSNINGSGGKATGAVSLMQIVNAAGEVIRAGGGRRTALMFALSMNHGDIIEFLDKKLDTKELNNANVSVVFDDDPEVFFERVKNGEDIELKFRGKVIGKASARDVWKKIIGNSLKCGEPGMLNSYYANKMSNVWYVGQLVCTNPCVTGDTLIAVADGRNAISIAQLANEGGNVPVYSTDIKTGRVEIKMGRFPRKTGEKKEIWKLTLDDGSTLKATPDHHVLLKNMSYVKLCDLKQGDSIFPFNSFNSNNYRQVCNTGVKMIGGSNGRFIDVSNEQLLEEGRKLFSEHGKITYEMWIKHAKENHLPQTLSNKLRFGSFSNFKNQVSSNHKVISVEFCGYEDVYNITVDDNHNYHVITRSDDDRHVVSSGICVKNCGEIWLTENESCDLGSIVLPRFVFDKRMDYGLLQAVVERAVRFLDDVISINVYPLPEIRETCMNMRRLGLGVMGLHDALLMMGLKYSSADGLEKIEEIMKNIRDFAYEASIKLAIEKGSFPKFDADKFLKSGFSKTLRPSTRKSIKENGIRNCALLTIAPTGTTSILCDTSSGIEPMFSPAYKMRYMDENNETKEKVVFYKLFKDFVEAGKKISHFEGTFDLSLRDHLEVQRVCQRYIDNSCSKTINLTKETSEDELAEAVFEFFGDLKGITVYTDGSRENQPLSPISIKEAISILKNEKDSECSSVESKCKSGTCDI